MVYYWTDLLLGSAYPLAIELEGFVPDRVERRGMGLGAPLLLFAVKELQVRRAIVVLAVLGSSKYELVSINTILPVIRRVVSCK